jgi:hypothetical protein
LYTPLVRTVEQPVRRRARTRRGSVERKGRRYFIAGREKVGAVRKRGGKKLDGGEMRE